MAKPCPRDVEGADVSKFSSSHVAEGFHWYAVQTAPRHEKCVRDRLNYNGTNCFLPVYKKVQRWKNGCAPELELPLFPGYLFVQIDLIHRVRVLELPGVVSLVGAGRRPSPLLDSEIDALRNGLQPDKCEPHSYLAIGQRVRITAGPLANWTGILERKNKGFRVVLVLDQIMQGVAVEVDANDIEILAAAGAERNQIILAGLEFAAEREIGYPSY